MEEGGKDYINSIPIEVLAAILQKGDEVDQVLYRFVCRRWKRVLRVPSRQITKDFVFLVALRGWFYVLQWAGSNQGLSIGATALAGAAMGRHTELWRWLLTDVGGCRLSAAVCTKVASESDLETLMEVHIKGCPFEAETFYAAVQRQDYKMCQYLVMNRCPWDPKAALIAQEKSRTFNDDLSMWLFRSQNPRWRISDIIKFEVCRSDESLMKKVDMDWRISHWEVKCFPDILFFKAHEPDSFAYDRGDNYIQGVVDLSRKEETEGDIWNTNYVTFHLQGKSETLRLLAKSLEKAFPRNDGGLPDLKEMIEVAQDLLASGYIVKDESYVDVWKRSYEDMMKNRRPVSLLKDPMKWMKTTYESFMPVITTTQSCLPSLSRNKDGWIQLRFCCYGNGMIEWASRVTVTFSPSPSIEEKED